MKMIIDLKSKMTEIENKARENKESMLSIIYNEYIIPMFPEGLEAKSIKAREDFVSEILMKDLEIMGKDYWVVYLNKGPSVVLRGLKLEMYQVAVIGE